MSSSAAEREKYKTLSDLLNPTMASASHGHGRYRSAREVSDGLKAIRKYIITEGIIEIKGEPPLRPRIWKLLLGVDSLKDLKDDYLNYVNDGPSRASEKIKDDAFRTLKTGELFKQRVTDEMVLRLLEAFEWKHNGDDTPLSYVQGMNVLAAPFLYTMPSQLEAFACFSQLLENHLPQYVQTDLRGVHRGVEILGRFFRIIDEQLYDYLVSRGMEANIYAMPSILTLCVCTPPLEEVLKLWDFLLAYGVHLNVLCVIAQLYMIRDELLESPSPMKLLRQFPPLNARDIITLTLVFVQDLSDEQYRELVEHPIRATGPQSGGR